MKLLVLSTLALPALLCLACEAGIGDACTSSNDCPVGLVCDLHSNAGYCLTSGCEVDEECPEGGTCVAFTRHIRYCLKTCKTNGDCRSGYQCRSDIGKKSFCYMPARQGYHRDPNNALPDYPSQP